MMRVMRLCCCLLALIGALTLSGYHPLSTPQATQPHASPASLTQNAAANPTRLVIPTIGLNASVESLGVLANGDLATPRKRPWADVGWYASGPLPGEPGSAVIDGHLDRPGGFPAVFWRLRDLQVGNAVLVMDAKGKTILFRVTRVALYPPQDAPLREIFEKNGGTYLNLITCAGDWIPSQSQTTLRLVVYTSLA